MDIWWVSDMYKYIINMKIVITFHISNVDNIIFEC